MTIGYGIQQLLDSSSSNSLEFDAAIQEMAIRVIQTMIQSCFLLAACFLLNINKQTPFGNGTSVNRLSFWWRVRWAQLMHLMELYAEAAPCGF